MAQNHRLLPEKGDLLRILMLGWEFPPFSHGGLGKACHGLSTSLANQGTEIVFVVPTFPGDKNLKSIRVISAGGVGKITVKNIISALAPYETSQNYENSKLVHNLSNKKPLYGRNLFAEVLRFTKKVGLIAENEEFDIIHAHDWMTFDAGILAKKASGKPLVVHVHSTEIDRTGGNGVNQLVYNAERRGMHAADKVIAVSNMEKDILVRHYGVNERKIEVIHNAINAHQHINNRQIIRMNKHHKIVLFLGRMTLQKGPDYFIHAAHRVAEQNKDAIFVLAGSGDMTNDLIEKAAHMGISDRVFFTGYISNEEIEKLMKSASVLVMPSVSEPFGLVALEAMVNRVPLIISKQSGVNEIVNHCIKVDFWDVNEMASNILALLEYSTLSEEIRENGYMDVYKMSWDEPAKSCLSLYQDMVGVF